MEKKKKYRKGKEEPLKIERSSSHYRTTKDKLNEKLKVNCSRHTDLSLNSQKQNFENEFKKLFYQFLDISLYIYIFFQSLSIANESTNNKRNNTFIKLYRSLKYELPRIFKGPPKRT